MSITKVGFKYKKLNLRYDSAKKLWIGYQIDVRAGKKRHRSTFATKGEAERFVDALRMQRQYASAGLTAPHSPQFITIRDLCDSRITATTDRKRLEFERRVFNYFCKLIGEHTKVQEITLANLRDFVNTRSKDLTVRNEQIKPQSVDRELTAIASVLHNAGDYFDELENYQAPRIPHPKFRKGRRERIITDEERGRLLESLNKIRPAFARIFEFASLTGLRHSEIMQTRTTDLDRKARSLKVYRSKTDSVSYISPLTDRMLELLSENFERGFVFTPDGKTPGTFYKYVRKACSDAGLVYGRFEADGIILHDTRHSFITKLQQSGIDLATIQAFSGHSDRELVMRYSHARPESRKKAMEAIDGKDKKPKLRKMFEAIKSGQIGFDEFVRLVDAI